MGSAERLAAFQTAYERLLEALNRVPPNHFGEMMETAAPRAILAQLIVSHRVCRQTCESLRAGQTPPGFVASEPGAEEMGRLGSLDRTGLLEEARATKEDLLRSLSGLEAGEWTADRGVRHPEGGPATIRRELESLSRRYLDATDEILLWLEPRTT
ncbi:MAG: hypothetical protein A2Z17_00100 [Gammaproteobacteria bacterium RBG_16_66_13]|nr:MAG: hypothetical protein A2Z17_00100 [Gammaproteobacteria bacterium RBG_16_66_13]